MPLLPLFVFFVLGIFVPGVLIMNIPGKFSVDFLLMSFVVIWVSIRLVVTGMTGKRRLTLMAYYIFMYVFMGVQPLLSTWSGMFPHSEIPFEGERLRFTITMVILGILCFEVGYYRLKDGFKTSDSVLTKDVNTTKVSIVNLWLAIGFVTILIIGSVLRYGPNIYLALRDGGFSVGDFQAPESSQAENLLVIFGLRGISASLLFVCIYVWKLKTIMVPQKYHLSLKMALYYLILLNIIVSNPLNAPRLWSGGILLTSLFIASKWNGARSFLLWSSGACIALLLLFSGTDPRRIFGQQLMRGEQITVENTIKEVVVSIQNLPSDLNFDAFQMIFYTRDYAHKYGFSFGYQMLLPAFFWVPRSIWNSKPVGTPDLVAEDAGFLHFNVSSPLWAEGYINFGILGLMVFLFLLGFFARKCDDSLIIISTKPAFKTIITCFFAANTFILLRGDLNSGTMYLQMVAGVTFLIIFLIKKRSIPHIINTREAT